MSAHYPATLLKVYGNQEHVLLDLTLGRLDAVLGEAPQLDAGFSGPRRARASPSSAASISTR